MDEFLSRLPEYAPVPQPDDPKDPPDAQQGLSTAGFLRRELALRKELARVKEELKAARASTKAGLDVAPATPPHPDP